MEETKARLVRLRAVRKWPPLSAIEGGPNLQPGDEALLLFYKDESSLLLREVRSAVFALSLKDKVRPLAVPAKPHALSHSRA